MGKVTRVALVDSKKTTQLGSSLAEEMSTRRGGDGDATPRSHPTNFPTGNGAGIPQGLGYPRGNISHF